MDRHTRFAVWFAALLFVSATVCGCGNSGGGSPGNSVDAAPDVSASPDGSLDSPSSTNDSSLDVGIDAPSGDDSGMSDDGGADVAANEGGTTPEAGDDAGDTGAISVDASGDGGSDVAAPDGSDSGTDARGMDAATADAADSATSDAASDSASDAASDASEAGPPWTTQCPADRRSFWGLGLAPTDWLAQATIDYGAVNAAQATDSTMGQVLRVQFPLGSDSTNVVNPAGVEMRIPIPNGSAITSALMVYWVRYNNNFPMDPLQGKLPGLCGGQCPGAKIAGTSTAGWSMRPKWGHMSKGEEYGYVVPVSAASGTDFGLGSYIITTGVWHHVYQAILLNLGTNADGIVRLWWDAPLSGPPTIENTTLTYRTDMTNADTIIFSTLWTNNPTPNQVPSFIDVARLEICL
jgi:hypothetical protein